MTKLTTVLPVFQVAVPSVRLLLVALTVPMFMGSLKVSCNCVFKVTAVAFRAGILETSVGAVVSGAVGVAEIKLVLLEVLLVVSVALSLKK